MMFFDPLQGRKNTDDPFQEWMRAKNPQAVIARFERGNFNHNEECWQLYIAALAQTGQAESILPRIMQKLEASLEAGGAKSKFVIAGFIDTDVKDISRAIIRRDSVACGSVAAARSEERRTISHSRGRDVTPRSWKQG